MDNGLTIAVVQVCHGSLPEFDFRSHRDVAQDGERHLREEALDQVEPAAFCASPPLRPDPVKCEHVDAARLT
jgi:hypothetical protein